MLECRTAKVTVTLRNVGKEAYRPDLYGNRIKVQRIIQAGATKTRLLSANGTACAHTVSPFPHQQGP